MTKILAIDPGVTIGFAACSEVIEIVTFQIRLESEYDKLSQLITEIKPDVVVYEKFDHRQRAKVDYTAVEQIGVIKLHALMQGFKLVPQSASYAKVFFDDQKLKHLGLYEKGKGHAMDALRHILRYRLDQGHISLEAFRDMPTVS